MRFTTLICTYNRHELLGKALAALLEQSKEKPDQVVVVNGGDVQADKVVLAYQEKAECEIRLVKTANKNLATSRNLGLRSCDGEIIAMSDDDGEVFPDWVTRMKVAHKMNPIAGAVGGVVLGTSADTLLGSIADSVTFPSWPSKRFVRTLPGVNISYKRDVIEQVGPQDETLFRGEDVDYNWRIKKLGYEILFDPSIRVWHHHRPSVKGLLHQQYMYGKAYLLVRRKWREMYCVYPQEFRTPRDWLKLANFFGALVYRPFLTARNIRPWYRGVLALPMLFALGLAWRGGMAAQMISDMHSGRRSTEDSLAL